VKDIDTNLNSQPGFSKIFDNIKFRTESNINPSNIYKSLEIIPYDNRNQKYNSIGDGKNKTLSLLLKSVSKKIEKQKLLIVEEPENHLYPQLQRLYSNLVDSLMFDQIIITTHSPTIIDFHKMNTIIKLRRTASGVEHYVLNFDEDDYSKYGFMLNEEFGQMLFYDKVLLVEGYSEKYFYNRLMIEDKSFLDYCSRNNLGIFAVGGIDFLPYKLFLQKLNISVCVRTDNDIFAVPKATPTKYRYAGIERVLSYLDQTGLDRLKLILGVVEINKDAFRFDDKNTMIPTIESNLKQVEDLFASYGVFLSSHHKGFEKDFLDFVALYSEENLYILTEAKLKNLHSFSQKTTLSL
jgi:putative ATP-dependent endonuclease of OLD family